MKPLMLKQSGVALVEFALIVPLLLLLTFVTTEFGRALFQYNILTKSVRDGVRYLTPYNPGDAAKILIAKNLVVYGNPAGTGAPLVIGLTTSLVPDPVWQKTTGSAPNFNTVTITVTGYNFRPLLASAFGLSFANGNGDIPFAPISATMRTQS